MAEVPHGGIVLKVAEVKATASLAERKLEADIAGLLFVVPALQITGETFFVGVLFGLILRLT